MPNIRELFELWKLSDEVFADILALGILYGRAVERFRSPGVSIIEFDVGLKAMIRGSIGNELPGTQVSFSKEQAEALLEFVDSGQLAVSIMDWTVALRKRA